MRVDVGVDVQNEKSAENEQTIEAVPSAKKRAAPPPPTEQQPPSHRYVFAISYLRRFEKTFVYLYIIDVLQSCQFVDSEECSRHGSRPLRIQFFSLHFISVAASLTAHNVCDFLPFQDSLLSICLSCISQFYVKLQKIILSFHMAFF